MVPRVYLFVGVPASGKSTLAQKLHQEYHGRIDYLSSDEIRASVFNDVADMSHNVAVFQIMKDRMMVSLQQEESVILDATFVKAKERAPFVRLAKEFGAQVIAYYVKTDLNSALERNLGRERKVPPKIIRQRFNDIQAPEPAEGFDQIHSIDNTVMV